VIIAAVDVELDIRSDEGNNDDDDDDDSGGGDDDVPIIFVLVL
jgi:hypothetical protein